MSAWIPYQGDDKELKKKVKESKVEYIDAMSPVFAAMINSGTMDQDVLTMRSKGKEV